MMTLQCCSDAAQMGLSHYFSCIKLSALQRGGRSVGLNLHCTVVIWFCNVLLAHSLSDEGCLQPVVRSCTAGWIWDLETLSGHVPYGSFRVKWSCGCAGTVSDFPSSWDEWGTIWPNQPISQSDQMAWSDPYVCYLSIYDFSTLSQLNVDQ